MSTCSTQAILSIPEIVGLDAKRSLIRIPFELDVPLTARVRRLIDTAAFRRLTRISQLGFVNLVYPGARHSRFEHSLGVYRLALLVLKHLTHDTRFAEMVRVEEAELFIVAALLHDIGHYPFCHLIEDLTPQRTQEIEWTGSSGPFGLSEQFRQSTLSGLPKSSEPSFEKGSLFEEPPCQSERTPAFSENDTEVRTEGGMAGVLSHEEYARIFLEQTELSELLAADWNLSGGEVDALLSHGPIFKRDGEDEREYQRRCKVCRLLRSILSGPVDIDKMDYLYRDSLGAGVPYGRNFDQERLIGSLCLNRQGDGLAISEKGKTAAEMMVFARYVMFSEVYWHHAVRSATIMFQHAFGLLARNVSPKFLIQRAMIMSEIDWLNDLKHLCRSNEGDNSPSCDSSENLKNRLSSKKIDADLSPCCEPLVDSALFENPVLNTKSDLGTKPALNAASALDANSAVLPVVADDWSGALQLLNGVAGTRRQLYKCVAQLSIMEYSDLYERLAGQTSSELQLFVSHLIERLNRLLLGFFDEKILEKSKKGKINKNEKTPRKRLLESNDLLIDTPPLHKEVEFKIDVYYASTQEYRSLSNVSPVIRALAQEQFDDYVKKVRFFAHPDFAPFLRNRCDLIRLIRETLNDVF